MRRLLATWTGVLVAMLVVDYGLGASAEYLNAWSALERLLGRVPSAGDSAVYARIGAAGELVCVLIVTLAIAALIRFVAGRVSSAA